MKIAGVVVLYNPSADNLNNIYKYVNVLDILYVIDNSDDNIERLKSIDKIKYIKLNENKGIAYALNYGAKEAIKDGYKWLLTMDQDSAVTEKIINEMVEYLTKNSINKIGLISPYHCVTTIEAAPTEPVEEKLEVMTSGNIINLDAYQKVGGFKDWLFIDCVDIEYGLNLNKNGYKVLRLNKIKMPHNLGDASVHHFMKKTIICSNHNAIRRYYMTRNTLYINQLYKDYYPEYCRYLINVQKGQIRRVILFEDKKISKLRMIIKGYYDFKKNKKGKMKR